MTEQDSLTKQLESEWDDSKSLGRDEAENLVNRLQSGPLAGDSDPTIHDDAETVAKAYCAIARQLEGQS